MAWCKFIRCLSGCATQNETPCKQIKKKSLARVHAHISIDFHVPTWLRPQVLMLKWQKQFNIFPTKYVYRYNYYYYFFFICIYYIPIQPTIGSLPTRSILIALEMILSPLFYIYTLYILYIQHTRIMYACAYVKYTARGARGERRVLMNEMQERRIRKKKK